LCLGAGQMTRAIAQADNIYFDIAATARSPI
jgi:hypothetical protein